MRELNRVAQQKQPVVDGDEAGVVALGGVVALAQQDG